MRRCSLAFRCTSHLRMVPSTLQSGSGWSTLNEGQGDILLDRLLTLQKADARSLLWCYRLEVFKERGAGDIDSVRARRQQISTVSPHQPTQKRKFTIALSRESVNRASLRMRFSLIWGRYSKIAIVETKNLLNLPKVGGLGLNCSVSERLGLAIGDERPDRCIKCNAFHDRLTSFFCDCSAASGSSYKRIAKNGKKQASNTILKVKLPFGTMSR